MKKIIYLYFFVGLVLCPLLLGQNGYRTSLEMNTTRNSRIATITIFEGEERVFTLEKKLNEQASIPQAIAMSNGNLVLLNSLEGIVELYNISAKLIFSNKFYTLPPYKEQTIQYSVNNKEIILLISENRKNVLYSVTNLGELKKLYNCENGLISGLSSTLDGEEIVYSIFNWNNTTLLKRSIFLNFENGSEKIFNLDFEDGFFQKQDDLFWGYNKKSAFCINYKNEEVLWKQDLNENEYYLDIKPSNNKVIQVIANSPKLENGKWIYNSATIIEKDKVGLEKILYKVDKNFISIDIVNKNEKLEIMIDSKKHLVN